MASFEPKGFRENIQDLWELLKAYALQEMVEPLRGLGRYLGFGVAGSLLLGLGVVLLGLAGLRFMQTEAEGVFDGNWSFAPYFIVLVVLVAVILLAASRINREPGRRT